MAVVRSGTETIVRHSRALIVVYYVLAGASGLITVFSMMVAAGEAVAARPWIDKIYGVASWFLGALAFGAMSVQVYAMGRALSQSFVAVGPDGLRLKLPKSGGDRWAPGVERRFKWEEVGDITYQGDLRRRVCTFHAGDFFYTLTQNNSPSPGTVARLLAEKMGVALTPPQGSA
jgi:hypothetical protein